MEQKTQKNGLINLLALVLVGGAGFAIAKFGNTYAGLVGSVFLGIGALVAAVSWFQMRLEHREQLEKFEFEELTKSASSSALFNASETEVFPADQEYRIMSTGVKRMEIPGFSHFQITSCCG